MTSPLRLSFEVVPAPGRIPAVDRGDRDLVAG